MDLINLRNADQAMKQTKLLAIIFAIILAGSFIAAFLLQNQKIEEAYTKSYVFDSKGNVYNTTTVDTKDMRGYEYENHVKSFYTLWYSFDEGTYKTHINDGLELIGEKGKELLNEYKDMNMENILIQKNIRYGIAITDIKVDLNSIPISGVIKGIQTGYRAKGSVSRIIEVRFTLYDVARTQKNVHGCKIDRWDVNYIKSEEHETEGEN